MTKKRKIEILEEKYEELSMILKRNTERIEMIQKKLADEMKAISSFTVKQKESDAKLAQHIAEMDDKLNRLGG